MKVTELASEHHPQKLIDSIVERVVTIQMEYIEMMAAAYLLKTDIDPREVELVQDNRGTEIVFYFRKRIDCTCPASCGKVCKGNCGCKKCHRDYQDFLSVE